MDAFKAEHFERRHGMPFPKLRSLSESECFAVAQLLRQRLRLPVTTEPLELVGVLDQRQELVRGVLACDAGFDLMRVLPRSGSTTRSLLINWYRFDAIDEIEAETLRTFFDDIWYPESDDIDILDTSVGWVVSVRHDGVIKRIEFS